MSIDIAKFIQAQLGISPTAEAKRYYYKQQFKHDTESVWKKALTKKAVETISHATLPLKYKSLSYEELNRSKKNSSYNFGTHNIQDPGAPIAGIDFNPYIDVDPTVIARGASKETNSMASTMSTYLQNVGSALNTSQQNNLSAFPSGYSPYSTTGSMPNSGSLSYQDMVDRNNALSLAINRENNKFNADQAQLTRDWQTNMANTAHQREVADLKAAGLNPVLSAGGSGAVTPSGATASNASYANVSGDSVIGALATLAASAMSANAATTAASISAAANMYGSDKSFESAKYGADKSYQSAKYGADRSKYGAIYKLMESFLTEYKPGDHSYVDNLFG